MNDERRRQAGDAMRRKVLGDAHVDAALARTGEFTAAFQDFITRYAWGEIWTRPGLDARSRRILVLGTLLALGHWDEFRMHAAAALLEGGFSRGDLEEIVLQQAVYCGVPAANRALGEIRDLLDTRPAASSRPRKKRRP
jgi:alkylhydroperoxidase/carboxymuconolactone decarboxylase family protein YurZ